MRIVESHQDKRYKISYYTTERYFYVEFEAGPMKQGYKFSKEIHSDFGELKNHLAETNFFDSVYKHFNEMYGTLQAAHKK
jgi:IS4 transposase